MRAIVLSCCLLVFLLTHQSSLASDRIQWASSVEVSSAFATDGPNSHVQMLGKPSFTAQLGSISPCAWVAHETADADTLLPNAPEVLIRFHFEKAVLAQQVAVFEQANAGAIKRITVKGDDFESTVLQREVSKHPEPWNILRAVFPKTPKPIHTVEVLTQPGALRGWNSIDACAISTDTVPIKDEIDVVDYKQAPPTAVHLSGRINSSADELMPRVSADGQTMYFCRLRHKDNIGSERRADIWVSKKEPTGFWSHAEQLSMPLNNEYSNFVCSTSPDGKHVVLANTYFENGSIGPGLSTSSYEDGFWSFPKPLIIKDYANAGNSVDYFLAADGNTLLLSVELIMAHGGNDIYVSFRQEDGTFSRPKSLGLDINTAGKELTMFLANDGRTLYFSSDGHNGYGGQDIFMSTRLDNSWTRWSEPKNLGPAINDRGFNGHFTIPASGDEAYFTSSERGSRGENDIYKIQLTEEMKPKPVHLVVGKVSVEGNDELPSSVRVEYETLSNGKLIGSLEIEQSSGAFTLVLPGGDAYGIHVNAVGFVSINKSIDLTQLRSATTDTLYMELKPLKAGTVVRLNNIFFETAKSELLPTSFPELNRVSNLLRENPTMQISIVGHTDNRGSAESNKALSVQRAKAVYSYLINSGVKVEQLKYSGVGSEQPVASNDTQDGMAENRRVEFTILKR